MTAVEIFPVTPWSRLERRGLRTIESPVHKTVQHMRPISWLPDTGKGRIAGWQRRKPIYSQAVASLAVTGSPFRLCPRSAEWRIQIERK